ncbi:hypothetical protein Dimus_039155 [Dionaea muscipula]
MLKKQSPRKSSLITLDKMASNNSTYDAGEINYSHGGALITKMFNRCRRHSNWRPLHSMLRVPVNKGRCDPNNNSNPNINNSMYHSRGRTERHRSSNNISSHNQQRQYAQSPPQQKPQQQQQQAPPPQQRPSTEDMLAQFITCNTRMQNQDATIKNLETQLGQIANLLENHAPGTLPSNTENNPRADLKAIELRGGKVLPTNTGVPPKKTMAPPPMASLAYIDSSSDEETEPQEKRKEVVVHQDSSSEGKRPPQKKAKKKGSCWPVAAESKKRKDKGK